uniref:Uncharacterized protein n=1 Tax=Arundo donax TaxID=35708 RepID=A0A0A9H3H2_ARUDO
MLFLEVTLCSNRSSEVFIIKGHGESIESNPQNFGSSSFQLLVPQTHSNQIHNKVD